MVCIGVAGLGYWGSKVFDEYADLRDDGEIDRVVAIDMDTEKLTRATRADEQYESVENAIDAVDAIHVCTNNSTHFPVASMGLRNDIDVLVEKPLTETKDEAYDLVEIASETGQILQTGHIFRFANVIRETKRLHEERYFGEVDSYTFRWTHNMDGVPGTDAVWDLLPHPVDILNFVSGDWPTDIRGRANTGKDGTIESAFIGFDVDNAIGEIQVSWNDHVRRRSLEIAGDKRSARIKCVGQRITIYDGDGDPETIAVDDNNTIRREAKNFVTAIETRENTFNSAIVGARTVDAIQTAHETLR